MTDPREYNPDELRRMAFERRSDGDGNGEREGFGAPPLDDWEASEPQVGPGEALDAARERELLRLDASIGDAERPYLPRLPEQLAAEYTVFEWLDFLTRKGGFKRALRALEYYRSVGWIGEPAEERLREYLVGMDVEPPRDEGRLDVDDHLLSLVYVGRLAAMD